MQSIWSCIIDDAESHHASRIHILCHTANYITEENTCKKTWSNVDALKSYLWSNNKNIAKNAKLPQIQVFLVFHVLEKVLFQKRLCTMCITPINFPRFRFGLEGWNALNPTQWLCKNVSDGGSNWTARTVKNYYTNIHQWNMSMSTMTNWPCPPCPRAPCPYISVINCQKSGLSIFFLNLKWAFYETSAK